MIDKKTLDKYIKVLSQFNDKPKGRKDFPYDNRVCYEGNLIIATDGKILVYKEVEENPDKVTHYRTKRTGKYEKTEVNEMKGRNQKVIASFDCDYDFTFTLDFDKELPLPDKLMAKWDRRYNGNKVYFDFDKNELHFAFNGGWENEDNDGCDAIYGDVFKDIDGRLPPAFDLTLFIWQLINIMKFTKERTLLFSVNSSYKRIKIVAGQYTFLCLNVDY